MTEIENQIPFSGIDPKGRLKFGVLLEMFQEMADIDASKYNLSVSSGTLTSSGSTSEILSMKPVISSLLSRRIGLSLLRSSRTHHV